MHEWALALSVVEAVDRWAAGRGLRVRRVVLAIPSVSQLDISVLREAFDSLKRESRLADATLEVRVRVPKFRCRACGGEFGEGDITDQVRRLQEAYGEEYPLHLMPDLLPALVTCPRCGSHDVEAELSIRVEEVETA